MKAAPAEFYEALLDDPTNAYGLGLDASPYRQLYERTAALVPKDASVVELGCGTGRLAALILERTSVYVGIDFAPRFIEEARQYAPAGVFYVADLRYDPIPDAEVYVLTEVLEHLDDDLGLLGSLPVGSLVILSVPSFDSESHVRTFPKPGDAARRYGGVLKIDIEERIDLSADAYFHLLRGIRR